MKIIIIALMLLFAAITTPSFAWTKQWGTPAVEDQCLTYDASYSEAPLFQIVTAEKKEQVHFYSMKVSCTTNTAECKSAQAKAYLIRGDVVFSGPEDKGYRCVYYGTRRGKILAGFIQTKNLAPYLKNENLTRAFLVGIWTYDGNPKITITAVGKDKVKAVGKAYYDGLNSMNTGEFAATASFSGKEMVFRDGDDSVACIVHLLRRGPYLVAVDNQNCGGHNVSFSSILIKLH